MRVIYCDACGAEGAGRNSVEIPCHLYSRRGEVGYADSDMNRVSGRSDVLDLCNACANRAYAAMVAKIDEIKEGV